MTQPPEIAELVEPRIEVHTEVDRRTVSATVDADPNHLVHLDLARVNDGPWKARFLTRILDPVPGREARSECVWVRDGLLWSRIADTESCRQIPGPPPPLWLAQWATGVEFWQRRLAEEVGR